MNSISHFCILYIYMYFQYCELKESSNIDSCICSYFRDHMR